MTKDELKIKFEDGVNVIDINGKLQEKENQLIHENYEIRSLL